MILMKALLITGLLLFSAVCFAQEKKAHSFKSFYELSARKPIPGKMGYTFPSAVNNEPMTAVAANIIQLPLDNMHCLVPDLKGFTMPVLNNTPAIKNMPVQ